MAVPAPFIGLKDEAPANIAALVGTLCTPAPDATIHLLFIPSGTSFMGKQIYLKESSTHLLIVLEEGAEADIILRLSGSSALHSTEVLVADTARCVITCIADAPYAVIRQRSRVQANASIHWKNVTLGAGITQDLLSHVRGAGGRSDIDWVFYATQDEEQTIDALNTFDAPGGMGEIRLKGAAQDRARIGCRGKIEIGQGGRGTNTYLTEDVLMLDSSAKVDAIPALEIKTNDVKASHSASVKRVSPEDLFYFAARGIPALQARRMFVLGFLGEMIREINPEDVREDVLAAIGEKYGR